MPIKIEIDHQGKQRLNLKAVNDAGEIVGVLRADIVRLRRERALQITWIEATEKRQRIGTRLYETAARMACEIYKAPLASDSNRSDNADSFWRKQYRKGRAQRWGREPDDFYKLFCPAPATLEGRRRR
jgi:hypothetical protein